MKLGEVFTTITALYGDRNGVYLRGDARIPFLLGAILPLQKAIRKAEKDTDYSELLARVFSRVWTLADSFITLDIPRALSVKLPISGCAYCGHSPCQCEYGIRSKHSSAEATHLQLGWSIRDWVDHVGSVYGAQNVQLGVDRCLNRLSEEVNEVVCAYFEGAHKGTLEDARLEISLEFADVFLWTFALTHLLDVDLENAVLRRYGGSCHECDKRPCACALPK